MGLIQERLAHFDQPEISDDDEAMWKALRPALVTIRIMIVALIVFIGEIFDDLLIQGLSPGVWGLIIGIPTFFMISIVIVIMDKRFGVFNSNDGGMMSNKE